MSEIGESIRASEKLSSIKEFSAEAKETLEKEGYLIYSLTGKSIKDLKNEGMEFDEYLNIHSGGFPVFENSKSMQSEIAIKSKELFLRHATGKNFDQQKAVVENFSQKISHKIKGVKAVIGEVSDYAELSFTYLNKTGKNLFDAVGKEYDYGCYTRTKTLTPEGIVGTVAIFGRTDPDSNLSIYNGGIDNLTRGRNVSIAPLIVPA